MRVLILRDSDGWAAHHATRALAAAIGPGFEIATRSLMHEGKLILRYVPGDEEFDIVYIHCIFGLSDRQVLAYRKKNRKSVLLGGVRGWMGLENARATLSCYDQLNVNNKILLATLKSWGFSPSLCHAGVDTNHFVPCGQRARFVVGWAGDARKRVKNAHLLNELGFPCVIATKPGLGPYYTYAEMPRFYNNISVLVMLSYQPGWPTAEGCPLPVLEAGACGRPVLATSTSGAAVEFLDTFQIVGKQLDAGGFDELRSKLQYLAQNQALRRELGERNRRVAVESWDWSIKAKQYEEFFNSALEAKRCAG